MTKGGITW